jgi:hypothetical protein
MRFKLRPRRFSSLFISPAQRRQLHRAAVLVVVAVLSFHVPNLLPAANAQTQTITFRAASSANSGSVGTVSSITVNKPAGVIEGDVMIMTIATTGNPTYVLRDALGAASTWTLLNSSTNTTAIKQETYWRVATATETASYQVSWSGAGQKGAVGIVAFSGVDNTDTNSVKSTPATGNSAAPTAATLTPTYDNAMLVASFSVQTNGSTAFTPPAGMTEQWDSGSAVLLSNNATATQDTQQLTGGANVATGTRQASSGSGPWIAHMIALKPASQVFELSGYRWYQNVNSIDFLGISADVDDAACGAGARMDKALAVAHDSGNGSVYMVGFDGCNSEQWHIERRNTADGVLNENFSGDGIITVDGPTAGADRATAVGLDNNGNVFVGGWVTGTSGLAANTRWRIAKYNRTNGAIDTSFGSPNGYIESDPGTGSGKNDYLTDIYVDNSNGFIYAVGEDSSPITSGTQWRVEKRNASTGALCDGTSPGGVPVCLGGTFGSGGVATVNPHANNDSPHTITMDESAGYIYIGGVANSNDREWRVEKRNANTGNLCTSTANCAEGVFGNSGAPPGTLNSSGFYNVNPANGNGSDDYLNDIELDILSSTSKYLYIGGSDKATNNQQWRITKINAISAAYDTAFDSDGLVTINPDTSDDDVVTSFAVDRTYDHVYIVGTFGGAVSGEDYRWRVEKRNANTGALCDGSSPGGVPVCGQYGSTNFPSFGGTGGDAAGVATSNPIEQAQNVNDHDQPLAMVIHAFNNGSGDGALYIVGFDRGVTGDGSGDTQWRLEKRNLLDGTRQFDMSTLAAQNTAARPFKVNMEVRLRMLLHVDPSSLYTTNTLPSFKLQYSPKSGTCDTSFVGENYVDITTSTNEIRWLDNSTAADGERPRDLGTDPTHGSGPVHTNVIQSYEEDNPFTFSTNTAAGRDALWDFALKDINAFGSFCVRVTLNDATPTLLTADGGSYTYVPEINFCLNPPPEVLMRHGSYFCGNQENAFFWSLELET